MMDQLLLYQIARSYKMEKVVYGSEIAQSIKDDLKSKMDEQIGRAHV